MHCACYLLHRHHAWHVLCNSLQVFGVQAVALVGSGQARALLCVARLLAHHTLVQNHLVLFQHALDLCAQWQHMDVQWC